MTYPGVCRRDLRRVRAHGAARDICKIDGERQSRRRQLWQVRERNSFLRILVQDERRRTATRRRNSPSFVFAVSRAGNKCALRANLAKRATTLAIWGFTASVTHVIVHGGGREHVDVDVTVVKEFQLDSSILETY